MKKEGWSFPLRINKSEMVLCGDKGPVTSSSLGFSEPSSQLGLCVCLTQCNQNPDTPVLTRISLPLIANRVPLSFHPLTFLLCILSINPQLPSMLRASSSLSLIAIVFNKVFLDCLTPSSAIFLDKPFLNHKPVMKFSPCFLEAQTY